MIKESLVGKIFGRLRVIKEVDKKGRDTRYLCICEDGNEVEVDARHLRSGKTSSCGCLAQETRSKNGKFHRIEDRESVLINGLFAKFKNDAKHRKIKVELKSEEFRNIVLSNCFYCGSFPQNEFIYTYSNEKIKYNGIDRIDNEKPYCLNNVVPCCWRCNSSKNNMSLLDFSRWLYAISEKFMKTETFVELTNEMKDNI